MLILQLSLIAVNAEVIKYQVAIYCQIKISTLAILSKSEYIVLIL